MRQRIRKFIGSTVLIVFVPVYALVIMAIAGPMLADASTLARTLFFLVTGLVWVLPAGALISWMSRDARPPS